MAPGRESAAGGLHLFYLVGIECINSLNPPDSGGYDGGWGANHMNEYIDLTMVVPELKLGAYHF